MTKDEIFLMDCCADGKGSAAASGNVALCNSTEKSMNSPCMIFWHICAGTGGMMLLVIRWVAGSIVDW